MSLQNRLNAKREELEAQQLQEEQAQQAAEQQRQQAIEEAKQRQEEMERQQQEAETQELRETIAKKQEKQQAIQTQVQRIEELLTGFTQDSKRTNATTEIKNIVHNPDNAEVLASMDVRTVADIIRHEEFQEDTEVANFHSAYAEHSEKKEELRAAREQLKQILGIDASEEIGYKDLLVRAGLQVQRLQEEEHVLSQELPETKAALQEQQKQEQQEYLAQHFSWKPYPYGNDTPQGNLLYSTQQALRDKSIADTDEAILVAHMHSLVDQQYLRGEMKDMKNDIALIEKNTSVDLQSSFTHLRQVYKEAQQQIALLLEEKPSLSRVAGTPDQIIGHIGPNWYQSFFSLQQQLERPLDLNSTTQDYAHAVSYLNTIAEILPRWVEQLESYQPVGSENIWSEEEDNAYAEYCHEFRKNHPIEDWNSLHKPLALSKTSQGLLNNHTNHGKKLPEIFAETYGDQEKERIKLLGSIPDILRIAQVREQSNQLSKEIPVYALQEKKRANERFEPYRQQLSIGLQQLKASPEMVGIDPNNTSVSFNFSHRYPLVRLETTAKAHHNEAQKRQWDLKHTRTQIEKEVTDLESQLYPLGMFQVVEKTRIKKAITKQKELLEETNQALIKHQTILQQHAVAAEQTKALENKLLPLLTQTYDQLPGSSAKGIFTVREGTCTLQTLFTDLEDSLVRISFSAEDDMHMQKYTNLSEQEEALAKKLGLVQ